MAVTLRNDQWARLLGVIERLSASVVLALRRQSALEKRVAALESERAEKAGDRER